MEGLLGGMPADGVHISLVCQRRDAAALRTDAPWAASVHSLPPLFRFRPLRLAWEQLGLVVLAMRLAVDVVHSPHYTFPLAWRGRRVVTLHDATFFSSPGVHSPLKRLFFRAWSRRAWRRADVVITPSAASASELERFLGVPGGVVAVAHLGVDVHRFHPPTARAGADFRAAVGLSPSDRWFAFLGTIEPRKNLIALLDAHEGLRDELGAETPLLLISGNRGWDAAAHARLAALPPESGVVELGYLPIDQLTALLGDAVAVVYPTLGEGFGLPVLESMACGAPVVTTNRLAIPEVGGDAVVYVEPTAGSIRSAMLALATDSGLRDDYARRGLARAATFSWAATARAHIDSYRAAARS